jgi:hypothetical protein
MALPYECSEPRRSMEPAAISRKWDLVIRDSETRVILQAAAKD